MSKNIKIDGNKASGGGKVTSRLTGEQRQMPVLHACVVTPVHAIPPPCGAGLLHVLVWVPPAPMLILHQINMH
jgi:hypothetical protein